MGEYRQVSFPKAQLVNLPACSLHCPINAERQAALRLRIAQHTVAPKKRPIGGKPLAAL